MTYRPNTAAAFNDPRFYGIERVELRAKYGAHADGASHPLATLGLAAAQALYPGIGLTSSTNLATFEQDTAAWLQAESDLRNGAGGIIGLADGAQLLLSKQLYLQNAQKVWFHGGRGVTLLTQALGTTPAVRVSASDNAVPLRDLSLQAKSSYQYVSSTLAGAAMNVYQTGAVALAFDNVTGSEFTNIHWNAYDQPIAWGDNTYCDAFRFCSGSACNAGWNWSQTNGLNSMERIVLEHCTFGNNNYGVDINATFTSAGTTYSQGGSIFVKDCSIDYNIVRQIRFIGTPSTGTSSANGLYVKNCHVETSGGNSGAAVARCFVQGVASFEQIEWSEQGGGSPPGMVEVADNAQASMTNSRVNANNVPLFYSSTGNQKRVNGLGNVCQDVSVRPILLADSNGNIMQPLPFMAAGSTFGDGLGLPLSMQGLPTLELIYSGTFTIPPDTTNGGRHANGARFQIINSGSGSITIAAGTGVTVGSNLGHTLSAQGKFCWATQIGANNWALSGSGLSTP